jgi:hypothetical protein
LLGRLEVSPAIDSRPDRITPGTHWIGGSNDKNGVYPVTTQSQSHVTTDDQSVSKSWIRAPCGSRDRILVTTPEASKEIYPPNGPQRKYHPIVVVTKKQIVTKKLTKKKTPPAG